MPEMAKAKVRITRKTTPKDKRISSLHIFEKKSPPNKKVECIWVQKNHLHPGFPLAIHTQLPMDVLGWLHGPFMNQKATFSAGGLAIDPSTIWCTEVPLRFTDTLFSQEWRFSGNHYPKWEETLMLDGTHSGTHILHWTMIMGGMVVIDLVWINFGSVFLLVGWYRMQSDEACKKLQNSLTVNNRNISKLIEMLQSNKNMAMAMDRYFAETNHLSISKCLLYSSCLMQETNNSSAEKNWKNCEYHYGRIHRYIYIHIYINIILHILLKIYYPATQHFC